MQRSKHGPKLTLSSVKAVATALFTSTVSSGTEDLTICFEKGYQAPWTGSLFREEEISGDCSITVLGDLVSSLCQKYSTLYGSCHGKDGYLKYQIRWHDFPRSVAAFVDDLSTSDAHVDDYEDNTSPVANAWLSLVTTAQSSIPFTETQFTMLHAVARQV